jgi:hypothetical protein
MNKITPDDDPVNKPSKTERLAQVLLRDRDRPGTINGSVACFACGRSYLYKGPNGDDSGMFCSANCRTAYDLGLQPQSSVKLVSVLWIKCAGCQREFESNGLRCCSPECERTAKERADNLTVMAEVGMESPKKRSCEFCGGPIKRWRKGSNGKMRATPKSARYCTKACQRKAAKAPSQPKPQKDAEFAQKDPALRGLPTSSKTPLTPTKKGPRPRRL